MASIREGHRPALLVVDVQVGVLAQAWDAERVVGNVARAVARAREQRVPVVWVQHESDELPNGSPPWQWVPELRPERGEHLVPKRFNSSFEQTTLDNLLDDFGVTHVVLAGAASNWCIRATAHAALERGYDLTLLSDAHTTDTLDLGAGERIEASQVIDELNLAVTWLRYPGRRNGTSTADTIKFDSPPQPPRQ